MGKFLKIYLFIICLLLLVSSCSSNEKSDSLINQDADISSEPKSGGTLNIAYDSDVSNYDPILGNSGNDHALLYPVYDTLVGYNANLEAVPSLAKKWEMPDDHTIILYLEENVTFHDGSEFNAEAVKYNLERVLSDESNISDLSNVKAVEVIDNFTVKLILSRPDSSIILALSDRSGMMVSPKALEKYGEDFSQNPVGTGPYKMKKWVRNGEIIFVKNQDYWQDSLPYLDEINIKIMPDENTRLNALKSNQVQFYWNVSSVNAQALKHDANLLLNSKMKIAFYNIYLNTKMAPFNKKEVRQALQVAINRESLVEALTFSEGEPAYQAFPSEYWASSEELKIPYDIEQSKELLRKVGLNEVSFNMFVPSTPVYQRIAEAIKGQVKQAGFNINIEPMELTKGVSLYFSEKQIESNLTSWTGRPDPLQTVDLLLSGDGYYNAGGETTEIREELITKAASAYNQEDRAALYKEINEVAIHDDAMTIPIMFVPSIGVMSPQVKGFEGTLLGKPKFSFLWLENGGE
ncbi:ABC transporter substrate-binding protein [Cytobacillus kochii]|uniref:ABC transporter substrate-binding protein n=1 Tax=Cytobacillus kochii TaxID=859143 RepID=UPI001CD6C7E7|nr:ABC transporter substrate-binding protein [Cytobacillus kochii]MCA1026663.1 ABC transporter substrate-binding protein [Cytobacillus kochii]